MRDSICGTTSGLKDRLNLKMAAILKIFKFHYSFILTSDMKRPSQIVQEKLVFMLMTSLITSQEIVKIASLYSLHFSSAPELTFKRP